MKAKIKNITDKLAEDLLEYVANSKSLDSYSFESGFNEILMKAGQALFQAGIGDIPKGVNSRIKVKTTFGDIDVPKSHPMSTCPMGFKISPLMQDHICRLGAKLVFSEASEEFMNFLEVDVSAKQIERICHKYGDKLDEIDWHNAYSDSVQMKIPFEKDDIVYSMLDGSMVLTREDNWREMKLGRVFVQSSLVNVSKNRNELTSSVYTAHLGCASEFWEKFSAEIPPSKNLVFINDGAKWIWNYIEQMYPNSTQILDFYHCKEHIVDFSKNYFKDKNKANAFTDMIVEKLLTEKVDEALQTLKDLKSSPASKESIKEKLYQYLLNNKKRINYGLFLKQDLLIGSGPIESAQRDVIQKRLKLSGQRWTIKGAQQIASLRVALKSNRWNRVVECIKSNQTIEKAA